MSPRLRRAGRVLLAVSVSAAAMAGICTAGVATAMGQSYPAPPSAVPGPVRSTAPDTGDDDRIDVAVVLGASGSVAADALVPYEVFARSDRFSVSVVAADRTPATLSGGLYVLPDRTFDEVTTPPDVVVVPAVVDPTGQLETRLRDWTAGQAARGSRVLGICDGARVLAAAGLLDGRRATAHWSSVERLAEDHPGVAWSRGVRYVEDGPVTTTAGITSGAVGALRLVEHLAGAGEAERVGTAVGYPGWSADGGPGMPVHRRALTDLTRELDTAFPWLRPTIGVGLVEGVSEIDVAAAAEVWSGASSAARVLPVGAGPVVTTQHGLALLVRPADAATPSVDRFVVPGVTDTGQVGPRLARWAADRGLDVQLPTAEYGGGFGFDPLLLDLARHADRATAAATAAYAEYPTGHLDLSGPAWPWRPTVLAVAALAVSLGIGLLPTAVRRTRSRRRTTRLSRPPSRRAETRT